MEVSIKEMQYVLWRMIILSVAIFDAAAVYCLMEIKLFLTSYANVSIEKVFNQPTIANQNPLQSGHRSHPSSLCHD